MITAVLTFALLSAIAEFILLANIKPKVRLRILGSSMLSTCMHLGIGALNLWIHWGTITGSMTAIVAFIASTGTLHLARWYWGEIRDGKYYQGLTEVKL